MPRRKPEPENKSGQRKRFLGDYARYSNLGFKLIAVILVAFFLGWKLDQWIKLPFPLFTLIFSLAGLAGVLIMMIRDLSSKK